jgi:hypothetical protein
MMILVSLASFMHLVLFCIVYRRLISWTKKHTHSKAIKFIQESFHLITTDFFVYVGSYLPGIQFLVILFRALEAQIDFDVILPNIQVR